VSDAVDRAELVRKAKLQGERLEEYARAVERGDIPDLGDENLPPLVGPDIEEAWERAGRLLREWDAPAYRLFHGAVIAFAAVVASPPSEN
jgi:hypothetical protein